MKHFGVCQPDFIFFSVAYLHLHPFSNNRCSRDISTDCCLFFRNGWNGLNQRVQVNPKPFMKLSRSSRDCLRPPLIGVIITWNMLRNYKKKSSSVDWTRITERDVTRVMERQRRLQHRKTSRERDRFLRLRRIEFKVWWRISSSSQIPPAHGRKQLCERTS